MDERDARQPIPASADQGKDLREVPAGALENVRADALGRRNLLKFCPNKYISLDLEEWQ